MGHQAYHHGDLRNALVQSAVDLITERGRQGFSLAEVSRRTGVSAAAPFRHFTGRDDLLAAVAERSYAEQEERFSTAVAHAHQPVEQLAAFAGAAVRFAVEEPALFDVAFGGFDKAGRAELEAAGSRVLQVLRPAAELLRPTDPFGLVLAVAAVAHGFALFLRDGVVESAATAEQGASAAARAIAAAEA